MTKRQMMTDPDSLSLADLVSASAEGRECDGCQWVSDVPLTPTLEDGELLTLCDGCLLGEE